MFVNTFLTTNLAESGPLTWDMAKQIIQTQSNLAMTAIAALVGIAAFLLVGSWVRNILIRKYELEKAIEPLRLEVFGEMKKDFAHLKKEITEETSKTRQEIEKNISSRLILLDAEKARIFAFINEQNNWWPEAAASWADAVVGYAKCKDDFMLRNVLVAVQRTIGECGKQKISPSEQQRKRIKKCLSYIPKILGEEKKEIEDKLKKLSG